MVSAQPVTNPFFHRGAIHDAAYFVGREYETTQVLSLLKNGQSISLVGQRRIGKTSLLLHVTQPETMALHGLGTDAADHHRFVYLDCGSLAGLDQTGIYRALLEEIHAVMAQQDTALPGPDPITYRMVERSLRDWLKPDERLILILDEFEQMSHNGALTPDFFSGLRALATRYAVAFVTASRLPLLELTYASTSTLSSPFFNIFASIRLGLFPEVMARTLIQQLAALAGLTYHEPVIAAILALAGTHPLLLQIAGYEVFELQQIKGAALTDEDLPELKRRFMDAARQHFDYYWRNLTVPEQRLLVTLPDAGNSDMELVRDLEHKALIVRTKDGCDYLSPAFRAFVQAQVTPDLIQAGPLVIDEGKRRALLNGQRLPLTELQYALLVYLAARADTVIANEDLERGIWGETFIEDPERLKSVVKGLRRALDAEAGRLENVRGVGYMWRVLT